MHGLLTAFAFLAIAVSAVPPEKRDTRPQISLTKRSNLVKDGVVNTQALRAHLASLQSKYSRTLATYEKNTGSPHPNARPTSVKKRQTGSVPLQDDNSQLWYGDVTVGTTAFTVDFDTGSSDFFLPGPKCDSTCDGHAIYSTNGATDTGDTFSVAYGDNSTVSGEVFIDTVTIAGLTANPQALGAAVHYSTGFQISQFPPDGLMGMAYPQIADITATAPPFYTLIANNAVASGAFGFKLSSSGAVLYLGGVDPSSSSGNLTTVQVTQQAYWQVSMDSANVNGRPLVQGIDAIIDTGTTLIVGDPQTVAQFYSGIENSKDASSTIGAGFFTVPCSSKRQVSLTFGGTEYDISKTFNLGRVKTGSQRCVGGIIGQDIGIDAWIAGDVFLANVYAEFSFDNNQVSFSAQA